MQDKDLRLLALDGGGVRGLSALMILQQLMETIDPENPPKPCDYFDMIGGTSTGGLIAIMLGRLQMSVKECIDAYLLLSSRIFQKKGHRVTLKGNIQGRFDSEELAQAVKDVLVDRGVNKDALLKDRSDSACKVFVCAMSKQTCENVCLTSYPSPRGSRDLLNSVKIWEACRATSAASPFFDPIAIGPYEEEFVDGAAGANNPVWEVWNEAQLLWGPQPLAGKTKCLVSIGTGIPSLKPFRDDVLHITDTLVSIATETEQTAERFRRDKAHLDDSGRYYRFNVDRGLEEVGLEESKKKKEIAAATRRYVGSQGVLRQIQAFASIATKRRPVAEFSHIGHESLAGSAQTLFDAVWKNDVDAVRAILASSDNPEGLIEVKEYSDDQGLALDWKQHWGFSKSTRRASVLHCAVETAGEASLEILRLLLQVNPHRLVDILGHVTLVDSMNNCSRMGGRPVLAPDENGGRFQKSTVLAWAAILGNVKAVDLLLRMGANVNSRDNWLGSRL
ncbi:FabD/lysophospholipase-like protein [Glarea lozoyensis ATCC 20868]|uniref:phospholipase A2 n=1 Tax=Glarea lozoyensis (strain ATCC 20868 / MF5171) TaxID=1116229 RepID=S3D9K9_GLAL2|nr:FabD/lysophospholipase-like protein [Glarea lozoyensis ATCC 20868]EPE35167.1 FabD/lysophospholipase-like protein [Glarea lozoyensis ATCC 20868]